MLQLVSLHSFFKFLKVPNSRRDCDIWGVNKFDNSPQIKQLDFSNGKKSKFLGIFSISQGL